MALSPPGALSCPTMSRTISTARACMTSRDLSCHSLYPGHVAELRRRYEQAAEPRADSTPSSSAAASCSTASWTTSRTGTWPILISCNGRRCRSIPARRSSSKPGSRPVLVVLQPDDYWHQPPPLPGRRHCRRVRGPRHPQCRRHGRHSCPARAGARRCSARRSSGRTCCRRRRAIPEPLRELSALSPRPQDRLGSGLRAAGHGHRRARPSRRGDGLPQRRHRVRDSERVSDGLPADGARTALRRHRRAERARRDAALPAPGPRSAEAARHPQPADRRRLRIQRLRLRHHPHLRLSRRTSSPTWSPTWTSCSSGSARPSGPAWRSPTCTAGRTMAIAELLRRWDLVRMAPEDMVTAGSHVCVLPARPRAPARPAGARRRRSHDG